MVLGEAAARTAARSRQLPQPPCCTRRARRSGPARRRGRPPALPHDDQQLAKTAKRSIHKASKIQRTLSRLPTPPESKRDHGRSQLTAGQFYRARRRILGSDSSGGRRRLLAVKTTAGWRSVRLRHPRDLGSPVVLDPRDGAPVRPRRRAPFIWSAPHWAREVHVVAGGGHHLRPRHPTRRNPQGAGIARVNHPEPVSVGRTPLCQVPDSWQLNSGHTTHRERDANRPVRLNEHRAEPSVGRSAAPVAESRWGIPATTP